MSRSVLVAAVVALALVFTWGAAADAADREYRVQLIKVPVFDDFGGFLEEVGEIRSMHPQTMIAHVGETVSLEFVNRDEYLHAFGIRDEARGIDVRTANLAEDESETLTFQVTEPGVYDVRCRLRYDPDENHCTPDHRNQRAVLIVMP